MNQFSLLRDWNHLTSNDVIIDLPPSRWKRKWGIDLLNAQIMYNALQLVRPSVIIETGTFEGHGCAVMAQALAQLKQECVIHTIDYDGDPLTIESELEWKKLHTIREENLEALRKKYPNVIIEFHDGDSRKILPELLANGIKWDFFFQDSMHFYEGIKSEWEAMKHYANDKAVAVFDDISIYKQNFNQNGRMFCEDFIKSEDAFQWNYFCTTLGHHQFWVQKK